MKNLLTLILLFLAIGLFAQTEEAPTDELMIEEVVGPVITFEQTTFEFGEIMDGDKVEHVFKFTNTGDEPLVISNAKGSCGCTVPQWPKNPIQPGEEGEIKVKYNSKNKGKVGGKNETKTVTITSNADPKETRLFIKGIVNKVE